MARMIWTDGYTAAELERAQKLFSLTFPPDLVTLLRDRRPVGGPDWNDEADVRARLAWPHEGLLFDVEQNGLWWPEWGNRPDRAEARANVLREVVGKAPRLIPIFGHRYLPATPHLAGNPVFSVHQSDV
ncbi:MAG: SMI1/KNR4 family protein, partial [Brevundimonas sp.]